MSSDIVKTAARKAPRLERQPPYTLGLLHLAPYLVLPGRQMQGVGEPSASGQSGSPLPARRNPPVVPGLPSL